MREGYGSDNGDGEGKGWKLSLVDVVIERVIWKKMEGVWSLRGTRLGRDFRRVATKGNMT